jgi:transposase
MASHQIILALPRGVRRRLRRLRDKTHDKTEFRRCQTLLQWGAGQAPEQIAASLGCAVCTIYRIAQAFREQGESMIPRRRSPGRPRKVTAQQEAALDRTIAHEPRGLGKNFSNWTSHKLALHLHWAVHDVTVLRYLWHLGWRWRRPVPRIGSPDPRYPAKARYLRRLRCQARQRRLHLYYADEMDVALLPTISGHWMRFGQQTQVDTPGQNAKQYVLGAVNYVTGALVWLTWPGKNNVGFRHLLQSLLTCHPPESGKIVVVVDNFKIHKANAVREWLQRHQAVLRLYFLPTYSPRLNPIERVWHHFRRNVTDNYFFKTMRRLLGAVAAFLVELASQPAIVLRIIVA